MVEEGERGDGEPSAPQGVAKTEDAPPLVPAGDAISPEEDAFLMQQASQPVDPAAGSHSPRSKAGTVSGEMAELRFTLTFWVRSPRRWVVLRADRLSSGHIGDGVLECGASTLESRQIWGQHTGV